MPTRIGRALLALGATLVARTAPVVAHRFSDAVAAGRGLRWNGGKSMMKALARLVAIVVLVTAAIAAVEAPAMASGGGCVTPPTNSDGWNVGVCTFDDGVYVYGDYYINRRGGPSGTCQSKLDIWDATDGYNITGNGWENCNTGHHAWYTLDAGRVRMDKGHKYYAWVDVYIGGILPVFSATNKAKLTSCCA